MLEEVCEAGAARAERGSDGDCQHRSCERGRKSAEYAPHLGVPRM